MAQKVTGFIKLQIPAGKATPAPPVGPALGQHGVNIMAFTQRIQAKRIRQCDCNLDCTVGIVALPHIHQTGQSADRSQLQIVEPILAARQSQYNCIRRRLFHEFRVIIPSGLCAVTAAHQEKVPDLPCLDCLYHLICHGKHCAVSESGRQLCAAVDAGLLLRLRITAQFQCFFNQRREILVCPDMHHPRISHCLCGKHPVCIAGFRRHQAVCGEENGRRNLVELLLLVLPCRAKVALEIGIGFQLRIGVRRQHLPVGVHGDSLVFGLFQEQLQVFQIVSRYHDKRARLDLHGNLCRLRCPKAFGIGTIQQRHALEIDFSQFQHLRQQFVHGQFQTNLHQRLPEKEVYRFVGISQHHGMVRIRCHATQSEQQQRFQRANVLLRLPELVHVVILVLAARRCTGGTLRHKSALFPMHPVDLRLDGIVIEVDIGQRHEQAFDHQFIRLRCCQSRIAVQRSC